MKYLIIGNGYIGRYLFKHLSPDSLIVQGYIDNMELLERLLIQEYPGSILINCAGKTGRPNIDWCEDHKEITFGSNVGLPIMIAETCKKLGKYWVHIGSGCIYDGYDKFYTEEDAPNFFGSFYSRTKIWSQDILSGFDEPLILRIRMPIEENLEERNYISKIVKYAKEGKPLLSTANSMTILSDMVRAIRFLTERGETGTFNLVNDGALSAKQVLEIYKKYREPNLKYDILPIDSVLKNLKAGRSNCVLSIEKLSSMGFKMPPLGDSIEDILMNK